MAAQTEARQAGGNRLLSAAIIAVPLAVLMWSFFTAPYLTNIGSIRAEALPALPNEPVLLYRNQRTRFYYTASDLLHPETFGKPGQYICAITYDVWPHTEAPTPDRGQRLTWYTLIWRELRQGGERTEDADAADGFRNAFGRDLRMERGGAATFAVPPGSAYRGKTGITHFAAIGIRIPEPLLEGGNPALQQFPQAAKNAVDALARQGCRGVGIPLMVVRRTLGERSATQGYSWTSIVREMDAIAAQSAPAVVLYGGWNLLAGVRELTDPAFRAAWLSHRADLTARPQDLAQEHVRLGALLVLAALATWYVRKQRFSWKRVIALGSLAGGLVYAIAQAGSWAAGTLSIDPAVRFIAEAVAALACGALIEVIVDFKPQDEIKQKGG